MCKNYCEVGAMGNCSSQSSKFSVSDSIFYGEDSITLHLHTGCLSAALEVSQSAESEY